jgi:hypothetical protein
MLRIQAVLAIVATWSLAAAHTVITYPGWRGNNLHTTGEAPQYNPDTIGIDYNSNNDTYSFPYGMQWMYPCKQARTGGLGLDVADRYRWRNALEPEQDEMAISRRRGVDTARLVPGSCQGSILRQHWNHWAGRTSSPELFTSGGAALPDTWSYESRVLRPILPPASTYAGQCHPRTRPQYYPPGHRGCSAWCSALQRKPRLLVQCSISR